MNTIQITVNGSERTVASALTLDQLLASLDPQTEGAFMPVASAVNGQYVAKSARADFVLNDRDVVTTFEPITGG